MADDFRDDQDYKHTRNAMIGSHVKSAGWSYATMALGALALITAPTIIGGLVFGAAAVFTGYKAWASSKDAEMAKEDINAQRTAHYLEQAMQRQKMQDVYSDMGTGTRFQDMVAANRNQQASR